MRHLALLSILLLLSAPTAARAAPREHESGTVRFALTGAIETLDPALAHSEAALACVSNVFDQLYEHDYQARPYRLRPALAAALPEVSEDGRTQTIQLRPGVRFVDDACFPESRGRELVAGDVVFCFLRLMDATVGSPHRWMFERKIAGLDRFTASSHKAAVNPARSTYDAAEGFTEVKGLEVVDDHTLRIHLLEPTPELAWMLASPWCSIYARESVASYGTTVGRHAIGTGPYRVLLFDGERSLTLRRSPTFREERSGGRDAGAEAPLLPRNDTVVVKAYSDDRAGWAAFLAGEVDCAEVARDAIPATLDPVAGTLLPHMQKRGAALHRDPRLEIHYDAFNCRDPVVGQPAGEKGRALRKAICIATDDRWAMERLYTNQAERVYGPILPEMLGYQIEWRNEALPGERESHEESLAYARQVLTEAEVDPKAVPPLTMHVTDDPTSRMVFDVFRRQLEELGLKVEPVALPWAALREALRAGKAQMWSTSWHADYPDAQNFLQCFYSRNTPEPNATRYVNREFDQAYEESRATTDTTERVDLLHEMRDLVAGDAVWRYRFRRIRWSVTAAGIEGCSYNDIAPKYFRHCANKAAR